MTSMFDIIIRNGKVVDGTGSPGFRADVGIKGRRILRVGKLSGENSLKSIDARGLAVSPGFIDMHSHSDLVLLVNPRAESKIRQGITTEVIGNCGGSAAPLSDLMKEDLRKTDPLVGEAALQLDWSTMKDYVARLSRQGTAVNAVPLIGHGNIRESVMGFSDRKPTTTELDEMKTALARAMEDGGSGMSTGLIYPPGCYAGTEELVELCKVVAGYGGIYASHIRGEGDSLLEAVREAIRIGEEAGLPVEVSHHKAGGRANWGKVTESLNMMDDARDRGLDVTCDVYPYVAASFGLSAMLPAWAHEGGTEKLLERLRDGGTRDRLRREMTEDSPGRSTPLRAAGWDATQIARCRSHPDFEGRTINEIAGRKKMDPFALVFDLLAEDPGVTLVRYVMCEDDVRTVLRHPASMIGTDGSAVAAHGILGQGKPHPRSYGTFPRVLRKYVREEGLLTLEDAIRKMTSLPARKLGLRARGTIGEGMYADVTIFDPEAVNDRATYQDPHRYPEGIEYVIVNGEIAVEKGDHTGALAGTACVTR
ncbi:MAG: N-acyl-D-amino-acid deacylase family protein [Dehalococcoidia bacterium]